MTMPQLDVLPGHATPAQLLYPDLQQELANTRKMLECVPDGNDAWKPHDKSMSLGGLATHLAELPTFATLIFTTAELDLNTMDWTPTPIANNAERLALFDKNAAAMTGALEGADWTALSANWAMKMGDKVYLQDRKSTLLRTLGINHIAHHRAQLGVFLRLNGIAIPGPYGPSADEM